MKAIKNLLFRFDAYNIAKIRLDIVLFNFNCGSFFFKLMTLALTLFQSVIRWFSFFCLKKAYVFQERLRFCFALFKVDFVLINMGMLLVAILI